MALLTAACASGDGGADSSAVTAPSQSPGGAGTFVALMRAGTEGADYEVFRSVDELVEASELVVAGEIVNVEEGRTINADEPEFFQRENVMLTLRVTDILAGQKEVRVGDEVLVEWPRPSDTTAQVSGPLPPVPVSRYADALPKGLRTLVAASDYTELNQDTVAKINVASHENRTIYSPFPQGFVVEGTDQAAIYAGTVVPTPSEGPGEEAQAPQTFDELVETLRAISRERAEES